MLNTEVIIELLKKHVAKGCEFKDTEKGCLCQKSIDEKNPLTANSACEWDVKKAALAEDIPDLDVVIGCTIDELEREGWQFTFKPTFKRGVGAMHKGNPPIGYADASQVWLGHANGRAFLVAADHNGYMIAVRPETDKTVEHLREALVQLVGKTKYLEGHQVPHDIAQEIGAVMAE